MHRGPKGIHDTCERDGDSGNTEGRKEGRKERKKEAEASSVSCSCLRPSRVHSHVTLVRDSTGWRNGVISSAITLCSVINDCNGFQSRTDLIYMMGMASSILSSVGNAR